MSENKSFGEIPLPEIKKDTLKKIRGFERTSIYIEKLFLPEWETEKRIASARNRVPTELREQARLGFIDVMIEEGKEVAPALRDYKREMDNMEAENQKKLKSLTDEEILQTVLRQYHQALTSEPEYAIYLAGLFLDDAREKQAIEHSVHQARSLFESSEDVHAKFRSAGILLRHALEVPMTAESLRAPIEFVILHKETDPYHTNYLNLRVLMELQEADRLPHSELIYRHVRPVVRSETGRNLHSHDRRREVIRRAQKYLDAGFLRLEEDGDLLDIVTDKTPYDKENDKVCQRWDRDLDALVQGYRIEKGSPVSMSELQRLLKQKHAVIENGLLRNYYWHYLRLLCKGYDERTEYWKPKDPNLWRKDRKVQKFILSADVAICFEVGWRSKKRSELAKSLYSRYDHEYRDVGDLALRDITCSKPIGRFVINEPHSLKETNDPFFTENVVDGSVVLEMLRDIIRPPEDCEDALIDLRKIGTQEGLDKSEVEKIERAIQDFATFHHTPPLSDTDCSAQEGQCLTRPIDFLNFCKKRMKRKIELGYYGDGISTYHQVNVLGPIVIDWTARQFGSLRPKPFPYVYRLDEAKGLTVGLIGENKEYRETARLLASGVEF